MLKTDDVVELQEKLLLIYKYISQQESLKNFFYQGLEDEMPKKDLSINPIVQELISMEDSMQILKECILELEAMKPKKLQNNYGITDKNELFHYLVIETDIEYISMKYGLKDSDEIEKLNIEPLIELI